MDDTPVIYELICALAEFEKAPEEVKTPPAQIVETMFGDDPQAWTVAFDKSEGFTRLVPVLVFFAGMVVSMGGLGYALKGVPVGTGYAIWVAIGAVTTVIYSMAAGLESFSIVKALLLLGLAACVVGLKVVSG